MAPPVRSVLARLLRWHAGCRRTGEGSLGPSPVPRRTHQMAGGRGPAATTTRRLRSFSGSETSTLLLKLIDVYELEGLPMPETLQEFARRTRRELLENLTAEEKELVLRQIPPEKRLEGLS